VNLSLFKEVWYTSEQELPAICSIAEKKLSFDVYSLKRQLDYGARTTETILGFWKCKVRINFLLKIQFSVVTYRPWQCINGKHVVDTFL